MSETIECGTLGCDQLITEIGTDGEYRQVAANRRGEGLEISMVPLCSKCLKDFDAKQAANLRPAR
jgi:hypothetical protein